MRLRMHAIVNMEFSELVGNIWSHHNLPALQSVFTLPGDGSLHSRVAGSGLQLMLAHAALICALGTKPGLQL